MATSPSSPSDGSYPSYKELQSDGIHAPFSAAFKRLFWPLHGTFPVSIFVMKTPRSPDDLEPYYQPDTGSGGIWHEISQLPLTESKVSSLAASVYDLEQWEYDWMAWHTDHNGEEFNPEHVTYGDLSDEDRPYRDGAEDGNWEEDSDTEFLVKCCGEVRPLRKRGLSLVVTASNGFVTIHDYVSAVHPWLISLREDIVRAKAVARFEPYPLSKPWEWMVDGGPEHKLKEKSSWVREHGPPRPLTASSLAVLERIRTMRNR